MTQYTAVEAPEGLYFDCMMPLTPPRIQAVQAWAQAQGVTIRGPFRYGPLPNNSSAWDISAVELSDITSVGWVCGVIQHPLRAGWNASEQLGHDHEDHFSGYLDSVGIPLGIDAGMDVEGCANSSVGYTLTWSACRRQRGPGAGTLGYYGWELGQTLEQFEAAPDIHSYWRAGNQLEIPGRGSAVRQRFPSVMIPGFGWVDLDDVARDAKGGLPRVCARVIAAP